MDDNDPELLKESLVDAAKNWLAIDGLWFLAVEEQHGLDAAIAFDAKVWEQFSAIEADRIIRRLRLPASGGLDALATALGHRLFALINTQELVRRDERTLEVYMRTCRTQSARTRKGLPLFPCKSIGIIDYTTFARAIDSRISIECISCPPDMPGGKYCCAWRFRLEE